ncbi:MAG: N-acetyltransferase [Pirellulaceae bacterium]|nr:N-acetyltransferase [Pirellulaceae bacterium]
MPSLVIKPVATSREKKQFLQLPWDLHRTDPNWIPPLRQNQSEMVGYSKNPFYDDAERQTFLALQDGKPVGRIAAILNHAHNKYHHENRGFWGFFESIDDIEVSQGLFEQVKNWFAAKGISMIRGPMNPSMNYEVGLLIDGFDTPPWFMMTYNPPYYPKLVEAAGYQKVEDMYAFWGEASMLQGLDQKLAFIVEECQRRFDIKLRRLNAKKFNQEVRMFLDIYNQSLQGTWGFTPLSEGEIEHMSHSLKRLIVPEMTTVAEIDGKPVGAQFGLLDYNPRIKQIDGRLFPFGFFRLLWNKRAIKKVRLISTNVIPEYQKWGVGLVIGARLVPEALAWGIQEAEFSWVLESNHLSFKTLKRGGAKITKTYRIYDSPGSTRGG